MICLILSSPTAVFALDPGKALSQYSHDAWTTREGLPQDTVHDVVQGRDGYLWLATPVGLARFDGVSFSLLDMETAGLAHDHIWGLFVARDGALWISIDGGGAARLKDGQLTSFTTANGLSHNVVRAIREGPDGTIWIATRGGGVNRYKDGKLTRITRRDGLPSDIVWALHADRDGGLWIGTNGGGLSLLKDGRVKTFTTKDGLPNDSIWYLHEDRRGALWIGTTEGLARLEHGRFTTYSTKDGLAGGFVRALHEDRDGNLWIGTTTGLSRLRDGRLESPAAGQGLSSDFVRSIHEDREGSLWIGTFAGGLHRLRDGRFTVYGKPEGLSHDYARHVLETRDGTLWIATNDSRLNRRREGRFTVHTIDDSLSTGAVFSLGEAGDGSLWVGLSGGRLCNLKQERLRCYVTGAGGLPSSAIPAVLEDSKGRLWAGTEAGLARLEGDRFLTYTTKDGLPGEFVRTLLEARDGRLWIGTTRGLACWRDGVITAWALGGNSVEALYEDPEGALWIGTRGGGLSQLDGGRLRTVTKRDGLADDVIYAILDDGHGSLWLTSHRGISRVDKKSLDAFMHGTLKRISSTFYDASDGMRSSECTPGSPAAWRSRDGRLWFATVKGLVSVDPADARTNPLPPPVLIEAVRADDQPTRGVQDVVVRAGTQRLAFRYTGLSFLVPSKVRFRYLLEGFDQDWTDAGTRREAYYTNVPPGAYRFRVTACNNDGVWSETPASVSLSLPPRFHQTRTFLALCAFGLVLSGAGLYWLRVRRLRLREQQLLQLVDERTVDLRRARDQLEDRVRERTAELARTEEKYRGIVENAVEGIFQTTASGRLVTANPALAHMLGYQSPVQLLAAGVDLERRFYVEEGRRVEFRKLLAERGVIEGFESEVYRKDGSTIWISENVRVTRDEQGNLLYEGTNEDITARKLAEARQTTQAAITRVLAESGSLDEAVPQLLRLICEGLGWDFGEVWRADTWVGRLVWAGDWQRPTMVADELEAASRDVAFAPGEGIVGQAWQCGRPLWSADIDRESPLARATAARAMGMKSVLAVPIVAGGDVPGVLVFFSHDARQPEPDVFTMMADVSSRVGQFVQRRRAEESLRRSQTLSAMGSLVAGVAHEVRNPLFAISANLDAFEAQVPNEAKYRPYLEALRRELERMAKLMEELLAFGKPVASELAEAPLGGVIAEAVRACEPLAKRAKVQVANSVGGELGRVSMDRRRLVQVFQNLVQNAIEHSPAGTQVTIDACEVHENGRPWVECSVKDSGPGFRKEDLPLIFEPFYSRRRGGTGLGLSIVQRIVDDHGGRIRVGNRQEGGGIVTVRLPGPSVQRERTPQPAHLV